MELNFWDCFGSCKMKLDLMDCFDLYMELDFMGLDVAR